MRAARGTHPDRGARYKDPQGFNAKNNYFWGHPDYSFATNFAPVPNYG